jgi:hypothetical protein
MKIIISDQIWDITQILNFMEIRPVEAKLFHADRRTDTTKLMVAFRNFANAPKKGHPINLQ